LQSSDAPQLSAEAISVRFGGIAALSDVSLQIVRGQILGLIGANGAGKSTLINVLSGFQRPTSGRLRIGDSDLTGLPPHRMARSGVCRTFQAVRLFGELTVFENVAAVASVRLTSHARVRDEAGTLLELFGLTGKQDRLAGTLAYADQRRLAIARALALAPRFLLVDEPAAGMSPEETADLGQTLKQACRDHDLGLLLVEHNMDLVMRVSDRIMVLDVGRVIASGSPADVQTDPTVRRAYLGGLEEMSHGPA
jgi:branched-chain amino acid transport system ATP-binding protein